MDGSRSPDRVPMTSPSRGVNPMDVSIDWPPRIAVTEAPFPRWAITASNSSTGTSSSAADRCATYSCEVPWKP
ncbi:hypothetical protein SRABI128_05313 [Microbacterium sp. Bi128]|nr:hypothetical protein SRABI128_05313 [Microbacterium sp. Bi128]